MSSLRALGRSANCLDASQKFAAKTITSANPRCRFLRLAVLASALMLIGGSANAQGWTISQLPATPSGFCVDVTGTVYFGNGGGFGDCNSSGGAVNSNINFGTGTVTANTLADGAGTTITGGSVTTNTLVVNNQANLNGGATVSNNLTVNPGTAVSMGGNRIMDVGAPLAASDAATKGYVDAGLAAANSQINQANAKIEENTEGIAIAIAMGGLALPPANKTFAVSANIGFYDGKEAAAGQAALKLDDTFTVNGGIGTGFDEGKVGGRVGLMGAW